METISHKYRSFFSRKHKISFQKYYYRKLQKTAQSIPNMTNSLQMPQNQNLEQDALFSVKNKNSPQFATRYHLLLPSFLQNYFQLNYA